MGHAFVKVQGSRCCAECGLGAGHPEHLMMLPGFNQLEVEHENNVQQAQELTQQMRAAKDASPACGDLQRNAPLFAGYKKTLF